MRVHLVDGTYELYRAHFAPRPGVVDPSGRDRKATVGLAASLLALLSDATEAVTHIAVAFDNPIVSFRNALFDGYKTDAGVPPELREQFDTAEEAVTALGIVVWSMDRHEADDALATGAARFAAEVEQVRLLTPDKDLGQCLDDSGVVQVDRMRKREITGSDVQSRFGVAPRSIPDLLALTGDSADGIPGVPGFGAKTAARLLAHYQHLEAIPDDPATWEVDVRGAARLASTLARMRADVELYRTLATLVRDVPLPHELEELRWQGVPRQTWSSWCDRLGAERLRDRPTRWR